ncbi:hypothetical protein [Haloarchaeobius sp. DFWS5]|uniref:hypothetical protein n=1 Tax=Haloarchaeobius sp. DFWS5 TaxID=3446114 RepID=UPI003EB826DD
MTVFDAVRAPAYTGERRCWPCTVVNLVLVAAVAVGLAALDFAFAGLAVAAVGVVGIWLRGYVVPFTPRFAPKLVAALPVPADWFHAPDAVSDGGGDPAPGSLAPDEIDGETVLTRLVEVGVVVPEGDDLLLADDFRERWYAAMRDHRADSVETLAATVQDLVPDARVSTEDGAGSRGPYVVVSRSEVASLGDAWLTRPVAVAEVAAVEALDPTGLDEAVALAAAEPLRTFLDECPDCGGPVEATTTVECCGGAAGAGSDPDEVLACTDCDTRLFTFRG